MFAIIIFLGYNISMLNIIVAPLVECERAEQYTKRVVGVLKQEKVEYSVYFSKALEDIFDSVEELLTLGETEFVVVGNDVVLSTFLNAVKDLGEVGKIRFGIVPVKCNDNFAKYLQIPFSPEQAIKNILQRKIDAVDYLLVNGRVVINSLIIGASAEIYELFLKRKIKNGITKQFTARRYGDAFSGVDLNITSRGEQPIQAKIYELSLSNAGIQDGNTISPLANVRDGLFNLNYATVEQAAEKGKYLKQAESGNHIYNSATQQLWWDNCKISTPEGKIKAIVDGKVELYDNLSVSVVPNGLKIYK